MQGFKRSTRPNLQSLREWLQHVATHPSLIKLPWVPAAEELWQQRLQPAGDPGGLLRQLAWTPNPCWCGSMDPGTPGSRTGTSLVGFARPAVTLRLVKRRIRLPAASSHTTLGTRGDNRGLALGIPCAVLPSWGFGMQHTSTSFQLGWMSWGWEQPSANRGPALSSQTPWTRTQKVRPALKPRRFQRRELCWVSLFGSNRVRDFKLFLSKHRGWENTLERTTCSD